ncbi:MAG: sulfatase-like hydrolase/transferase [Phycisphaerae bacterium]|nr:sulfatase-like hydrolase/transferase [Phycisphaerae bacterium]
MDYYRTKPHGISRRSFLRATITAATWGGVVRQESLRAAGSWDNRPNFIIFFTDDQGYNDVGCFGSPFIRTPNFDRMAREGMKFTSFYAQPVCGPSRAALMTGCYPIRVGEPQNKKNQHTVLHPKEITIAEVLKGAGYSTAMVGKWHLAGGRKNKYDPKLMPNAQGFDYFYNYLRLNAVRSGKWKLVPPRPAKPAGTGWSGRMIDAVENTQLYDLEADIEERYDLAEQHPQIVARLTKLIDRAREDLGDHETVGSGARFFDGPRPTSRS